MDGMGGVDGEGMYGGCGMEAWMDGGCGMNGMDGMDGMEGVGWRVWDGGGGMEGGMGW